MVVNVIMAWKQLFPFDYDRIITSMKITDKLNKTKNQLYERQNFNTQILKTLQCFFKTENSQPSFWTNSIKLRPFTYFDAHRT